MAAPNVGMGVGAEAGGPGRDEATGTPAASC